MKKALSILCTVAVIVTLFSVASMLTVSADADTSNWIFGFGKDITTKADGTLDITTNSTAVLDEYINTQDPNLDVSVKFTAPFANASQYVTVYLTKDKNADIYYTNEGIVATRFSKDGEKYSLNNTYLNGTELGFYGGGYIPLSNGSVTIRIKYVDGLVRLYMDDTLIYGDHENSDKQFSEAVTGLEGAYLGVAVESYDGVYTATILEVNGKNPSAEKTYAASDWIVGGDGVSVNPDGTTNVANSSYLILDEYINTTDTDLDVSVKFTAPYANAAQYVTVYLTKDKNATASKGDGIVTTRFNQDKGKYGLNYAWLNGNDFSSFCGGYIPLINGSVTIRIKYVDGLVRLYMDDTLIYYSNNNADTQFSEAVMGLGGAYLGFAVESFQDSISATLLEVNGKNPTGKTSTDTNDHFTYGTAGILNTLVDEKQGLRFNYTLTTTATDAGETVTVYGKTYTIDSIGMLVSTNATASMSVGADGVKQGTLTTARKIERDGDRITYTFSILIKNIGQANKSTDIYARPYLACTDGTILYGVTQVTNVYEMYNALGGANTFSDEVVQWMA